MFTSQPPLPTVTTILSSIMWISLAFFICHHPVCLCVSLFCKTHHVIVSSCHLFIFVVCDDKQAFLGHVQLEVIINNVRTFLCLSCVHAHPLLLDIHPGVKLSQWNTHSTFIHAAKGVAEESLQFAFPPSRLSFRCSTPSTVSSLCFECQLCGNCFRSC